MNEPRGAFQAVGPSAESCGERLIPSEKAIQVVLALFPLSSLLSGSRQVSASLIAAMTPPQHTTLSSIIIPRNIIPGLMI